MEWTSEYGATGSGEAAVEDVLAPSALFVLGVGTPEMTLWQLPANTKEGVERAPLINALIDDRRGLVAHANVMLSCASHDTIGTASRSTAPTARLGMAGRRSTRSPWRRSS